MLAYEPVWAIGTGVTATDEQAQDTQAYVRSVVKEIYGEAVAEGMRIQYGGSMKGANAAGLLAQKDIDGGLIGPRRTSTAVSLAVQVSRPTPSRKSSTLPKLAN